MHQAIACPSCKAPFDPKYFNSGYFISCPACASALRVDVFPALIRPPNIRRGENLIEEGQSSCFYHPAKNAEAMCDGCGRFLCGLCDIDMSGKHFCPSCIESGRKKGKMPALKNEYTRYDKMALAFAAVSILFWPISFATAPASLILSLYHWKTPCSLVQKSKSSFILSIILSLMIITAWIVVIMAMFGIFDEPGRP